MIETADLLPDPDPIVIDESDALPDPDPITED